MAQNTHHDLTSQTFTYSELQPGSPFKDTPTPVTGSSLMLFPLPDNRFRLTPPLSGQFLLALQISAQKLLPKKLSWSDSYVPCGSAWLHMFMELYLFLQCSPFSLHLSPPHLTVVTVVIAPLLACEPNESRDCVWFVHRYILITKASVQ